MGTRYFSSGAMSGLSLPTIRIATIIWPWKVGLKNLPILRTKFSEWRLKKTLRQMPEITRKKSAAFSTSTSSTSSCSASAEDGHTASLFPNSPALDIEDRLVTAALIPEKKSWRMTLTFRSINESRESVIYALGAPKAQIVRTVLDAP